MIFHPALTYLANDYGLVQIPVEIEGKEPSPAAMKFFIDTGREKEIKTIFVQKEFDIKNAGTIADEIGADITIIDPLCWDWPATVRIIIDNLVSVISIKE